MIDKEKITISIVIPCYNEEGNIEILFNQIKNNLTGIFT